MEATQAFARPANGALAGLRRFADAVIDLDFTAPLAFAALAVLYVASRIAWLDLGYGTDPDAWRVAITADYLWDQHDYFPSRLPGYPLHELVTAGVTKYTFGLEPWVLANLSTVGISIVGVYLFAWLAKKLEVEHRGALTLAFAFAPLLWINSVMTMDYMWALTFLLAAYLALLYGAPNLAGLSLGIAAGFRLTSLFFLPALLLFLWRSGRRHEVRPLIFSAASTTIAVYAIVMVDYGINFLNFYDQDVALEEFVKRLGKDGLGIVGGLAVLAALALSLGRLRHLPGDLRRDPHVLLWTATIVLFVLSYLRLPHEIAYLIPLFPFGFFLMARYMGRGVLVVTLLVIVLAGFVDITSPDDETGIDSSTFTSARIGKGMLLSDIDTLHNQMDFAREIREVTITHPDIRTPAVVVTGFIYPELAYLYRDELEIGILDHDLEAISQLSDKGLAKDVARNITYVWLLEWDEFQFYDDGGTSIYLTEDAARSTFAVYGYRPGYFGSTILPLSRDNPSLGEGTADTDR